MTFLPFLSLLDLSPSFPAQSEEKIHHFSVCRTLWGPSWTKGAVAFPLGECEGLQSLGNHKPASSAPAPLGILPFPPKRHPAGGTGMCGAPDSARGEEAQKENRPVRG